MSRIYRAKLAVEAWVMIYHLAGRADLARHLPRRWTDLKKSGRKTGVRIHHLLYTPAVLRVGGQAVIDCAEMACLRQAGLGLKGQPMRKAYAKLADKAHVHIYVIA